MEKSHLAELGDDNMDCTVKKFIVFPVPSRDVTNQTLSGREKFNNSRPGRVWLVTSRLGPGKTITFIYSVCLDLWLDRNPSMKCLEKSHLVELGDDNEDCAWTCDWSEIVQWDGRKSLTW